MTEKEILQLLNRLLGYAEGTQPHRAKRCGRYLEGIEDCISAIEKGNFNHIIKRDRDYKMKSEVKKIYKTKTKKKK